MKKENNEEKTINQLENLRCHYVTMSNNIGCEELKEDVKALELAIEQLKKLYYVDKAEYIDNVRCLKLAEDFSYGKTVYGKGRKILVDPTGYVVIPKFVFPVEFLQKIGVQETGITSFKKLAMKGF